MHQSDQLLHSQRACLWTSRSGRRRANSEAAPTRLLFVQPPPDTKDWTWTLTRRCDQCGLSAGDIKPEDFAERAFIAGEEWVQILRSSPAVAARPSPAVWSPLEYGAHDRA